ncbi:MAG: hypothetical protein Faunusvirus60_4, partial [Faunusvirus sp.]
QYKTYEIQIDHYNSGTVIFTYDIDTFTYVAGKIIYSRNDYHHSLYVIDTITHEQSILPLMTGIMDVQIYDERIIGRCIKSPNNTIVLLNMSGLIVGSVSNIYISIFALYDNNCVAYSTGKQIIIHNVCNDKIVFAVDTEATTFHVADNCIYTYVLNTVTKYNISTGIKTHTIYCFNSSGIKTHAIYCFNVLDITTINGDIIYYMGTPHSADIWYTQKPYYITTDNINIDDDDPSEVLCLDSPIRTCTNKNEYMAFTSERIQHYKGILSLICDPVEYSYIYINSKSKTSKMQNICKIDCSKYYDMLSNITCSDDKIFITKRDTIHVLDFGNEKIEI